MVRTILLVEDEEDDVFFLRRAMEKAGMVDSIQVACNGQEAIEYFQGVGKFTNREEFPLPYLVLLDLKLPRVMGLDVLKWIRQQSEMAVIVIVLSSSKEEADITAAYHLGANAYLVKSSDAKHFVDMAKSIKEFWLMQNTPPPMVQHPDDFGASAKSLARGH
jgi:DNA-binding response OmpR family regulator